MGALLLSCALVRRPYRRSGRRRTPPRVDRRADRPTSERAYPVAVPSLVSSPFHPHPQARAELGRAELAAVCPAG